MTRKQATTELLAARARSRRDDLPENYMPRRFTPSSRWAVPGPAGDRPQADT